MNAYSYEEHHDIMELSDEEKKINIKIHYIATEELLKKELINQDVGYEEIINFIDKKKLEVIAEEDITNDYIEDLVNELK